MHSPARVATLVSVTLFGSIAAGAFAQRAAMPARGASPADATARIVASAQALLTLLDDAERGKVQFRFDDAAQRARWSNLPSPMFQRVGLRLGDLTPAKRDAVMKLLSAALSTDGYRKVNEIMEGDEVLRQNGGGNDPRG